MASVSRIVGPMLVLFAFSISSVASANEYLVGDWNGDGKDDIGVRIGAVVHMDTDGDGLADLVQSYGNGDSDAYLVGDWDGDGRDNLAVRRGGAVLMDVNFDGYHDRTQNYGNGDSDAYLVGDWNGDGRSNLAVVRGTTILIDTNFDGYHDDERNYAGIVASPGGSGRPPASLRDPSVLSYGRGVGTIPASCPAGQELEALRCFDRCPAGYLGALDVCYQACPSNFTEVGPTCAKPPPYERTPYAFNPFDDPQMTRCERTHGRGNCEWGGAVVYPKCEPSYSLIGWTTCSPTCPSSMTDVGAVCTRPSTTRRSSGFATSCGTGRENQAGLCYPICEQGFVGVGPVCWRDLDQTELKRQLEAQWRRMEPRYRPIIEALEKNFRRLQTLGSTLPTTIKNTAEGGDLRALESMIELDEMVQEFRLLRQQTNVARAVDATEERQTSVTDSSGAVLSDRAQAMIDSGRLPSAAMQTSIDGVDRRAAGDASGASEETRVAGTEEKDGFTLTLAAAADASVGIGATYEIGHAFGVPSSYRVYSRPYHAWAKTLGVSIGGDFSVDFGYFEGQPTDLCGDAKGLVIAAAAGPGLSLTIWIEPDGALIGATDGNTGFLGINIAPQVGAGAEIEIAQGTTYLIGSPGCP